MAKLKLITLDERHAIGRVPIPGCLKGRVYWLRCRNLVLGVYDGEEGFIGIRTKFGDRYLFTEYHWDQGPPYGTVKGCQDTGIDVPEEIVVTESLGDVDADTRRPVVWSGRPDKGGKGWVFADTGEGEDLRAIRLGNPPLFKFLDELLANAEE